jgi:DNA-binding CsgD family transcriptional regulator
MRGGTLERALDMLDYALLIVDERGRLEYRNRAAAALLRSVASPLRRELRRAVSLVCVSGRVRALFAPEVSPIPLRIVLVPIALADGARGAAIWMADARLRALPDEPTLRILFGLSHAEARLALGLLAGSTARECARSAGVGIATVRSQLHSMFAKTGARRQAELVALLSRVPALEFARIDAV